LSFCSLHAEPGRASELGRRGGLRNRHTYSWDPEEVPIPESASDVKRLLAESMAEVRGGQMDPKLGTTLAYIGISLLKVIETADMEARLARLEKKCELDERLRTGSELDEMGGTLAEA
jgi:hypothetical protein